MATSERRLEEWIGLWIIIALVNGADPSRLRFVCEEAIQSSGRLSAGAVERG